MKKIVLNVLLLITVILLTSCNQEVEGNTFNPEEFHIKSQLDVLDVSHSVANGRFEIEDKEHVLSVVYVNLTDSEGNFIYTIPYDYQIIREEDEDVLISTFDINYLIQNETYTVTLLGYIFDEDTHENKQGILAKTTITTGIWDIKHPEAEILGLNYDSTSVVFDLNVRFNDLRGRKVTVKIQHTETVIDTFEFDWFHVEDFHWIDDHHVIRDIEFDGLEPNTVYNIFVSVLCREYDYDTEGISEYYSGLFEYAGTFKTNE